VRTVNGIEAGPFRAVAVTPEVIPRTLVQNAGGNAIRPLTALRVRLFSSLSNFSLILYLFYRQNRRIKIRGVSIVRRVISWA
jgi:hypothetical protein